SWELKIAIAPSGGSERLPLGSTLFVEGYLITSDWNYLRLYGANSIDNLKVGVLSVESEENIETVKAKVRASLPNMVSVMTHEEFIAAEKEFWAENHPAGTIFNFGVMMGFVVGVVIVYQVLYADVNDHLAEYATLKAMGYPDKSLLAVVFQEAIILAVLGFIPGFGVSIGMYGLLEALTQMPLAMQSAVALRVFFLTLIMCLASGAIAIRKLQSADPAEVF
ncbi:MAG: FtsX-like permease family protein, partial [Waterburya sp.]